MISTASRTRQFGVLTVGVLCLGLLFPIAAHAAKPCRTNCKDTTAPAIAFAAPASGSSVAGTVAVQGTSSDNAAVASVAVQVDGGVWQPATGTTSWTWSWPTTAALNGAHTLTARASDTAGNTRTVAEIVTVANPVPDTTAPTLTIAAPAAAATVSGTVAVSGTATDNVGVASVAVALDGGAWQPAAGTTSWTWSWPTTTSADGAHTLAVRATDAAGNATSMPRSVTVVNADTSPPPEPVSVSYAAPQTQGTWVSPEGLTIIVDSAAPWTIAQIYALVQANALDLDKVGPTLTIDVQDQYGSQTQTSAVYYMGRYGNVKSTMWLLGVDSNFALTPDTVLAHEYGHAWSNYWYYVANHGSWAGYLAARWTNADGSLTLATDPRSGSSYDWATREVIADDYRLLFGSAAAIAGRPGHLNSQIVDPRNVPGLADFLLNTWRGP